MAFDLDAKFRVQLKRKDELVVFKESIGGLLATICIGTHKDVKPLTEEESLRAAETYHQFKKLYRSLDDKLRFNPAITKSSTQLDLGQAAAWYLAYRSFQTTNAHTYAVITDIVNQLDKQLTDAKR